RHDRWQCRNRGAVCAERLDQCLVMPGGCAVWCIDVPWCIDASESRVGIAESDKWAGAGIAVEDRRFSDDVVLSRRAYRGDDKRNRRARVVAEAEGLRLDGAADVHLWRLRWRAGEQLLVEEATPPGTANLEFDLTRGLSSRIQDRPPAHGGVAEVRG